MAFAGIDRCFERYHRKGPRRRPLKIDFCDADVLDAFDEWRRATGITPTDAGGALAGEPAVAAQRGRESLPAHLQRVVVKLTGARANGSLDAAFDGLIDRVAKEHDAARAGGAGLRGAARQATIERLAGIDSELVRRVRESLTSAERDTLAAEAESELAAFRSAMSAEAYGRAREAAIDRLVRERKGLPTIAFA